MELNRGKIVLDQKIGREKIQVMLDGEIIVPDIKPDMAMVLQTEANVVIDSVDLSADRINFAGKLNIGVLYLARGSQKLVHSISVAHTLDDFINMEGVTKDCFSDINAGVGNIDFKIINDRKLGFRAVVDVDITCTYTDSHEVVSGILDIPENQMQKLNIKLSRNMLNKTDKFVVKDEITLPAGKPNIREILQTNAVILNKDVRVLGGKVAIAGEIVITTLYKGGDDSLIETGIGHPEHGDLLNLREAVNDFLNLPGADLLAPNIDRVAQTVDEEKIAGFVLIAGVTSVKPASSE